MRTIHKFEIHINTEIQTLELPEGSQFLYAEYLMSKRSIFVWYEVSADMTAAKREYKYRVFSTGDGIPDHAEYLSTAVDQYLPEVYHIYQILD